MITKNVEWKEKLPVVGFDLASLICQSTIFLASYRVTTCKSETLKTFI